MAQLRASSVCNPSPYIGVLDKEQDHLHPSKSMQAACLPEVLRAMLMCVDLVVLGLECIASIDESGNISAAS